MTLPNNTHTLAVREALNQGAGAAEKQLALIGNEHGDSQLALIVEDLSVPELIVMVDEFDMTKPSLVSAFLTADQFTKALDSKAQEWGHFYAPLSVEDLSPVLLELQGKIEDFLCPIIYSADSSQREYEMLSTLFSHPQGARLAFLAGVGRKDFHETVTSPDHRLTNRATWQSLLLALIESDQKGYKDLVALYKSHVSPEEDPTMSAVITANSLLADIASELKPAEEAPKEKFLNF